MPSFGEAGDSQYRPESWQARHCCAERSSFSVSPESWKSFVGKKASLQTSSGGWWFLYARMNATQLQRVESWIRRSVQLLFNSPYNLEELIFGLIVLFATRIALGWCKNQQLNSYELSSKNVGGKRVRERDEECGPFYKV